MIITVAVITMCVLGIVAGAGLGIAAKKFAVNKDPKIEEVLENLPGVNCGACGFPGCAAMAEAIVAGSSYPDKCPVASEEAVLKIARIMGVTVTVGPKLVARLLCGGDKNICAPAAVYRDMCDCNVMMAVSGGGKPCTYGCMGGGNCVRECAYGAMRMNGNGLPEIFEDKCISCGLCAKACPRELIKLIQKDKPVIVNCSSKDKGPEVRKICSSGCIGCGLCVKSCPESAITMTDFLASIDAAKCTVCGICIEKCPTKAIIKASAV